jgi:hypothetical protein
MKKEAEDGGDFTIQRPKSKRQRMNEDVSTQLDFGDT